jgi:hypothetical protein
MPACTVCLKDFTPSRIGQKVCGYRCSAKIGPLARKSERQATRVAKDRIKTRQQWAKEAQDAVNRYVRLRDYHLGCISCDKPASWPGQWHASHFRSVGAASAVRFHLWNIRKSCSVCNNWKSGNLSEYEPRLRALIGDERVDWLRAQNQVVTYSVDHLKRLKSVFARKARRINDRRTVAPGGWV